MHVPGWHEATEDLQRQGKLRMIGIVQEQHPERARLFMQWKQMGWPLMVDALNLLEVPYVPITIAIDEHGIVRSTRPDPRTFEEDFLLQEFHAPDASRGADAHAVGRVCAFPRAHHHVTPESELMAGVEVDAAVADLEARAARRPDDAYAAFCAGVARRMRYDSPLHRPEDFQAAIDHWTRALELDPNQYVWRRRIQQYGPRMDKPYPFYTWIEQARRELRERGETPVELRVGLTPAELAEPRGPVSAPARPGDPEARVARDEAGLVGIESAVAFDTSGESRTASVHVALRPDAARDAHWNHEAGPTVEVWLGDQVRVVEARTDVAVSEEVKTLSFERELDAGERLVGYALYYVCEGADGRCLFLRQEFEVAVGE